ncbi:arylesterase [Desulfovibrio oxyclinae]|uniref:arylesterase n=1 Tax=Desulfovibrio oxyclinae TaxID=63560 RepID=UPI0003776E95|nr:arylesterase [Desulfovibrio oxyclinae]
MKTLAVFGDSLTEGYGLKPSEALPAALERRLRAEGIEVKALNFGISGETSEDGLHRMNEVLKAKPDAVIVAFGANDFYVGDEPDFVRENIETLCNAFIGKGIPVLLGGIKAIPDVGAEYKAEFDKVFPELAEKLGIPLFPNVLAPYFGNPMLTLMDGLHPNEQGVERMAEAMLPHVRALLKKA